MHLHTACRPALLFAVVMPSPVVPDATHREVPPVRVA
jgi:hypothetical protein